MVKKYKPGPTQDYTFEWASCYVYRNTENSNIMLYIMKRMTYEVEKSIYKEGIFRFRSQKNW
ncbi:hypothetical protein DEHRE_10255 [Dehalobacter restrictus DSM 9455]|uniref:Uncharacterized protein n=1 Tax=Dehalobacter restrictus (strain DSM 9455 / PER-K23) TaxID=871738 RepID=A0ABM5PAP3_DEHRP|nr:hypothetical protein DEHRE_10255 [Dehalobacter restrictus DSM 9455]